MDFDIEFEALRNGIKEELSSHFEDGMKKIDDTSAGADRFRFFQTWNEGVDNIFDKAKMGLDAIIEIEQRPYRKKIFAKLFEKLTSSNEQAES